MMPQLLFLASALLRTGGYSTRVDEHSLSGRENAAEHGDPVRVLSSARLAADTLLGRVTTDSGAPLPEAQIIVTMGPDRIVKSTASDTDGRWILIFEAGTGDYLVYVAAPNRTPFRKRVTRTSVGITSFTVDAVLKSVAPVELQRVTVNAKRPKPDRRVDREYGAGIGEDEQDVNGIKGAVPPESAGDLASLAATTPGVIVTPGGGISALGLRGQTTVTLGGLAFGANDLPRDAPTSVRVITSSYDPSLGWFGSTQTQVYLNSGGPFSSRQGHITANAPFLQITDRVGKDRGQRTTSFQASVGGDGPLYDERVGYGYGLQISHRTQDAPSLLNAKPDVLEALGLSPDSSGRAVTIAHDLGIPLSGRVTPSARTSDQFTLLGTLGRQPFDYSDYSSVRRTWTLTAYGAWRRNAAYAVEPTAAPSRGGEVTTSVVTVQGGYSAFIGRHDWLLDLRTSLASNNDRQAPYLDSPGAIVETGSGLSSVSLGGNDALRSHREGVTWETLGEVRFYPPRAVSHRVTLTSDVRFDERKMDQEADRFGTFSYQSLQDLAAGQPSMFTRTSTSPSGRAQGWNGFLALGDYWRPSPRLQLMYGLRSEAGAIVTNPNYNSGLDSALGVRNDHTPTAVDLSPRIGFTWTLRPPRSNSLSGPLGEITTGSAQMLRGGFGKFRSLLSPDAVLGPMLATGLRGSGRRLVCIGDAVPVPDWGALSKTGTTPASPNACSISSGTFADTAPSVNALDRGYTAAHAWRGNLAWSSMRWSTFYSIEATWSANRFQSGIVDANFAGITRFFTSNERRPVFVSSDAIVASTGLVAPREGRRSDAFGNVMLQRSDLRSLSKRITLTLRPEFPQLGTWFVSGSYTLGNVRQEAYGFDGATFGDPRYRTWARGDFDVRHQFLIQGGTAWRGITVTGFGRVLSGLPFTPIVGSDVNGDGYANDLAFMFDPALGTTDPALAQQLRALLAGAPASIRTCLTRAIGSPINRNGCEGPWTVSLNLRLNASGPLLSLGKRVNVALNLENPLGGLDQLLHGNNTRGWGTSAYPDPQLYQVRGFDAVTRTFRYVVNPLFGSTRSSLATARTPFRATLDVAVDVGVPFGVQQLDKWFAQGRAGHTGKRLTRAELQTRYRCNVPNPYRMVLGVSDSIFLTGSQVEALQDAHDRYRAKTDSVWLDLANYMDSVGDRYDASEVYQRQEASTTTVWEIARLDLQRVLPAVLSPVQQRLIPAPVRALLTARAPVRPRIFVAGQCDP